MAQSIPSGERFARATLTQGDPPTHTVEGHERCAYYPTLFAGRSAITLIHEHDGHTFHAAGAFYSEDYIKELRHLAHEILGLITYGDKLLTSEPLEQLRKTLDSPQYWDDSRVFAGPMLESKDKQYLQHLLERLREATV